MRDVSGLALFLLFFAFPAALVGALAMFCDGIVSRESLSQAALNWWVGDSISVTSFTPFLLLYVAPSVDDFLKRTTETAGGKSILRRVAGIEALELAAELAGIAAALWLVLVFKPAAAYQPLYLLLLPVIWMAVRHGFARATLAVLVINVGVIATATFAHPDPDGLSRRQLVMLALALTGLCLGAVIGERHRAEEALRLSEEKFAKAFHASPAALSISILSDGRLLEVNDTFLRLFEYDRHEVIGKTSLDLNLWAGVEERSRVLDTLRKHGRIANQERRHYSSSGRMFTVLSSMETIEVRGVQCLLATFVDITQAKEAQRALTESEQRYRDLVTHSHEGVWRVELDRPLPIDLREQTVADWLLDFGYIAECNVAFARITGFSSPEEVIGRRLRDLFPPSDSDVERAESIRSAARGGFRSRTIEFRGRYMGGEVRNLVRTEIPIIENGLVVRVWGVTRDVTEQKQAERALRESEERFRTTFENAGIGMAVVDLEGSLTRCNAALQRMLGYTGEELRGMTFIEFTHPDDRDLDLELYRELLAGKRDKYEIEKRYIRKDGRVIWGHLTGSLVKDGDGAASYGVGMVEDITERKRAEGALRKLNAELEQRVEERTQQLNASNRELEVRNTELSASNQELEAFSYSVAHDLRAPLRQIQGFSHLLQEDHRPDLPPDAHKYIRNIIDGAQHMGRLIDDLLKLSRIGRQALSFEVRDLATLVEEARRDLARETVGRDVRWQIGELPLAECDAVLMRQVFVNLLSNALKYTERRQPAVIEIGQVNREGLPVVFVKDNGVGFNMKHSAKLFGVFQRLHRREDFEGTGVGLATVKRIIEKHGGRIWAEAELEKGATFYFTLAARRESEAEEEALPPATQR